MAKEKVDPNVMVRFVREDAGPGADVAEATRAAFDQLYKGKGWVEVGLDNKPISAAAKAEASKGGDQ